MAGTLTDSAGSDLIKDLDQLAKRVNFEEGVPMFLACEDLASGASIEHSNDGLQREFNEKLVSTFCRDIEVMSKSRPNAQLTDIAKVLERLAELEFGLSEDTL